MAKTRSAAGGRRVEIHADVSRLRNIGIIAHIDAGKTTVSERILYYSGKEHRLGEVDEGTAKMDWMPEEQERGITITSAATSFTWRDHHINLIDTPGHVDFTAEVERALRVLDGAIGVFCGVGGVEAQSETVWRQANRYRVPRIAFVNKLDRVGSDFFAVLSAIRDRLKAHPVATQIPIGREKDFRGEIDLVEFRCVLYDEDSLGARVTYEPIPEQLQAEARIWRERLIEAVAEFDDELLSAYLEEQPIPPEKIRRAIRRGTLALRIQPVLCGSALRNKGVQPLLDAICDYLPAPDDIKAVRGFHPKSHKPIERRLLAEEPFSALAFKSATDPHGDLTFLRIYSGALEAGNQVLNVMRGARERVQKILLMHANERTQLKRAEAGSIVVVVGLKETATGDTLADPRHPILLEPPRFPDTVIAMAIEPRSIADRDRLLEAVDKLSRDDPTFRSRLDTETGQLVVSGMGELHLEVIKDRLLREFQVAARVGKPRVAYRQTIVGSCVGEGVFEKQIGQKNHFAQIRVRIEHDEEADKPIFESRLDKAIVPLEFHPHVDEGVRGAVDSGGSLGLPLIKIRVITEGGEFRPAEASAIAYATAGSLAVRDALERAGVEILEPLMRFEIQVPDDYFGGVINDFNKRRALIQTSDLHGDFRVVRGTVPLAEVFGYTTILRSLTQGRGAISMAPETYAPVPPAVAERFY